MTADLCPKCGEPYTDKAETNDGRTIYRHAGDPLAFEPAADVIAAILAGRDVSGFCTVKRPGRRHYSIYDFSPAVRRRLLKR